MKNFTKALAINFVCVALVSFGIIAILFASFPIETISLLTLFVDSGSASKAGWLLGGLSLLAGLYVLVSESYISRTLAEEKEQLHRPFIEAEYEERWRQILLTEYNVSPNQIEEEMQKYRKRNFPK